MSDLRKVKAMLTWCKVNGVKRITFDGVEAEFFDSLQTPEAEEIEDDKTVMQEELNELELLTWSNS